jgi:2-polyprenyl-6-methoxyphenol hydroxylase-like FAD-dependent oxidoreductase
MIETTQEKPILVAGGGIGGLATALALAKKGAHVRVLEQSPQFAEIGAGIQLGPNVFRMFEWLGVTDEIARLAVYPEYLILRDCVTANEVTKIPIDNAFRDRFKYPYALIHRADLHAVLLAACQKSNLIALHTSQKVSTLKEQGDQVTVKTEQGTEFKGTALIGADGIWSTIRQILIGDGKPRVSGHICYRAVLPTKEMPEALRLQAMMLWAGEKTHLVHYPLRSGELFNLVAVFHSSRYEEGWDSYGDPKELHDRFAGTCAQVKEVLAKIESWRMWVLCDREPIRDWCRGRVALLGDAAHPMLQYLAQGACMAIEDAVVLANKLDKAKGDVAGALLAYRDARYIRTGRVQLTARLYGEVYHASGATRDVRNATLAPRTAQQAFEAMAWLYDGINPDA